MPDQRVEKMRAFIIKFVYYCILLGIVFVAFKYAFPVLSPFLLAFLLAFVLKPVINLITKKTQIKRRTVAILTLCVFYILFLTLLIVVGTRLVILAKDGFYALPGIYASVIEPALTSVQAFIVDIVKNLNPEALSMVTEISTHLNSALSSFVTTFSASAVSAIGSAAGALPGTLVNTIMMVVASFFCVVDYYKITNFIALRFSPKGRALLFKVKNSAVDVLFKFGRAYALLMSITFLELFVGLSLLRIDYSFLLALLIAVVDILPVLGTGTVLIPWAIVTLILGNFPLGIGLGVLYAIITVVRQSLEPKVVGQQIGLHPLVTLISMFVGASLFGVIGLFGIPIAVTILVQMERSDESHTSST